MHRGAKRLAHRHFILPWLNKKKLRSLVEYIKEDLKSVLVAVHVSRAANNVTSHYQRRWLVPTPRPCVPAAKCPPTEFKRGEKTIVNIHKWHYTKTFICKLTAAQLALARLLIGSLSSTESTARYLASWDEGDQVGRKCLPLIALMGLLGSFQGSCPELQSARCWIYAPG